MATDVGLVVEGLGLISSRTVGIWTANTSVQSLRVVLPCERAGGARVGFTLVSTGISST